MVLWTTVKDINFYLKFSSGLCNEYPATDVMTEETQQNLEATVMYIDDDSMMRKIVKDFFEISGIKVVSVRDLEEFYKWHKQNQPADFYISDGSFPEGMNSGEYKYAWKGVSKYLTTLDQRNPGKIKGMIVVSGTLEEQARYNEYPVIKGTMWKPPRVDEMVSVVKSCLAGTYKKEFFNVR